MVAAIGMACGAGFYWAAVIATAIALVGLGPLRLVSQRIGDKPHRRELEVELEAKASAAPVLAALEQLGVGVSSFSITSAGDARRMACVIELPNVEASEDVVLQLGGLEEVSGVKWTR